jgi:hypothetical protein
VHDLFGRAPRMLRHLHLSGGHCRVGTI